MADVAVDFDRDVLLRIGEVEVRELTITPHDAILTPRSRQPMCIEKPQHLAFEDAPRLLARTPFEKIADGPEPIAAATPQQVAEAAKLRRIDKSVALGRVEAFLQPVPVNNRAEIDQRAHGRRARNAIDLAPFDICPPEIDARVYSSALRPVVATPSDRHLDRAFPEAVESVQCGGRSMGGDAGRTAGQDCDHQPLSPRLRIAA